ncbi:MAG: hypothetical protein CME70_00260 [Halobacteriovorax sp.]|nr:hypothetical protein [Halobacteriovorax sp.]|tara:strand:- start:11538 stop:11924 length:387 start_codon:yes stop_codon:yes gene_type:complete
MKNLCLIGLIGILFYTNVFSSEGWVRVPVKEMKSTDLEGVFEVISNEQFAKVKLDCLSFIHGMNFYDKSRDGDWELSYSFPLSEAQCNDVYKFLKDNLEAKKPACVELNIIDGIYELSEKEESCQLGS